VFDTSTGTCLSPRNFNPRAALRYADATEDRDEPTAEALGQLAKGAEIVPIATTTENDRARIAPAEAKPTSDAKKRPPKRALH